MAAFQATLINELVKLYRKKKALAAIIISFLVIVIGQLLVLGVRSGYGLRGAGSVEFPILVLSVTATTILPLFTALVAIDSFSGEFSGNTMRIALTRPVSRLKLFTAKVGAITVFSLANLALLFVFSSCAGFIFNVNSATVATFFKTFSAYMVTILPLFVLSLGVIVLANIFKSGTSVFFVSVLGFIALKVIGVIFTPYAGLLITSHLDWFNLWLANSFPFGKILRQFMIMSGYAIMLFTAGFYLFDRKEF